MARGKRGESVAQTSDTIWSRYLQSGLWRCPCSPSGAHHWLIDDKGVGQCRYCGQKRQFAEAGGSSYGGASDMQWGPAPRSEESLRELLPIA
ncbi:MAG: hypothetical protein KAT75_02565 [Dehalococcoidia bacterium]|nr:hypothetical protein [Dehalococcoidia bacterium]